MTDTPRTPTIQEMPAGREMDALVAEKVMGWAVETMGLQHDPECGGYDVCVDCEHGVDDDLVAAGVAPHRHDTEGPVYRPVTESPHYLRPVPEYSTDIAAAWLVVRKLREHIQKRGSITISLTPEGVSCDTAPLPYRGTRRGWGWADTAPLAICRAALLAVLP